MTEVSLSLSDTAVAALHVAPDRVGEELRFAAAVKLFELGRLSSGAAAAVAGVPKPLFLQRLTDYQVPAFRPTAAEVEHDFANA